MATDEDWAAYDRAEVDLEAPGHPVRRLVPDRPGATGAWPEGLDPPVVVVTAWDPDSVPRAEADNRAAHAALVAGLDRAGLAHWPATGRDPHGDHAEVGVAVTGLDEAAGVALGRRYGQAAVYVWTPGAWEVVSCTDDRRHVHGWRLVDGGRPPTCDRGPAQ